MNQDQLSKVALAMVARGKGILAADESNATIKKRFDGIGVESTETTRRDYREFMFRSQAMRENISGVILYDETIRQNAKDGTPLVKLIEAAGALPGIKVDTGAHPMPFFPGETITEGLDGLPKRMAAYYELGARFAKWRAVIRIAGDKPTGGAVRANMQALARYAAICQQANIVPIVEPEVLMDGAHSLERNFEVTRYVLQTLYQELFSHRVFLEGTVLKPNMVVPGEDAAKKATPEEVAAWTLRLFREAVPVAVPGIAFLSGGQDDVEATANLNAINRLGAQPWPITFSYGRALQAAAQKAWSGKEANVAAAQAAFNHRAKMNGLAAMGEWTETAETAV
ncbi:MAG: fructose-bisphosphate aldolase class I [Beijerinckiaceae bacterium]|nr:fructose-bisphosphate aldolase class I [Beijerinckiaceae bacterium]